MRKPDLHEGSCLYPYRPSSVKNRQRFNFGVVYPQLFSEAQNASDLWTMQTECLVQGSSQTEIEISIRFLQLTARSVEERVLSLERPGSQFVFHPVSSLSIDAQTFYSWDEAVEREIRLPSATLDALISEPVDRPFLLLASKESETLLDSQGGTAGRIVRKQEVIAGCVELDVCPAAENLFTITVRIRNVTQLQNPQIANRDNALLRSLVSTHAVLGLQGGEFVSLLDPPGSLRPLVDTCHNVGLYPVLVGEPGQRDTMLASPIILYDYPEIAPESAGDLFDGTEIDEILSLRIMTMTDEEKSEMRQSDERARQMLERTETLPVEQLMKLHGVLRGLRPAREDSR